MRGLGLEAKGMNYSTEVTSRLLERGIVPVEVAIEHRPRVTGVSSMKLVRGAVHRFLFVAYIALRQLLLRLGILMRPTHENWAMTVRIALFCGGRGSATIIRALLRRTDIELTLLVNGYDDGLSTGALRNFIPGMLGPSDFRKNLSYLFGNYSQAQYALKSLMEYRLAGAAEIEKLARFAQTGDLAALDEPLKGWFGRLPPVPGAACAIF